MAKWSEKMGEKCPHCNCKEGENHDKFCRTQISINPEDRLLGVPPLKVEGERVRYDPYCLRCGVSDPFECTCVFETENDVYNITVKDGYRELFSVLREALDQAQSGKGAERHANGEPFTEQPALTITRAVGLGFPLGQAMKKIQECQRMDPDAAKRELLGAINYLAAAILYLND